MNQGTAVAPTDLKPFLAKVADGAALSDTEAEAAFAVHRSKAGAALIRRSSTLVLASSISPGSAFQRARSDSDCGTTMLGLESFTFPSKPVCIVFRKNAAIE